MGNEGNRDSKGDTLPRVETLSVEPTLATRLGQYRRRLARLAESPSGGAWAADELAALEAATAGLVKAPHRARAAEVAWIAVHEVRQSLCLHDDRAALIDIAHEVASDLADHATTQPRQGEVGRLLAELVRGKGEPTALQRNELFSLAIVAAAQHQSDWHRANHLVQRRFRAALAVVALLAILLVVLPFAFERITVGQGLGAFAYSWAREAGCILAVLACGALGGLMSVLVGREQLQVSSVEHHLLVATCRLRPVIGAASALVFFVLWESGVLQMADAGRRRTGYVSGTLLLMAVVAGFSERLLLGQIEKLSAAFQRAVGRPGPDAPEDRPAESMRRDPPTPTDASAARGAESTAST